MTLSNDPLCGARLIVSRETSRGRRGSRIFGRERVLRGVRACAAFGTGMNEQPCTVVDLRDGSYAVRFVRQHAGLYQASAC